MQKALFAGRPDDVVFWSLVYAHYCGGEICPAVDEQIDGLPFILRDRSGFS